MPWLVAYDRALRELYPTSTRVQLAEHFNVSLSTIDRRCRLLGLRRERVVKPADEEEILERLMLGYSLRRIAVDMGLNRETVTRYAKQYPNTYNAYLKRIGKRPNGQ